MTSKYDIATLIDALKSLYTRIASLDLNKRMSAYQQGNGAASGHDLASILAEDIDKLAISSDTDTGSTASATSSAAGSSTAQRGSKNQRRIDRKNPQGTHRFTELTRFFKGRKNGSTLQPHVAEKLKASVWEHINAALRLARTGEAISAKLHADLADNALQEAARYMPAEEYTEFYAQIEKQLSSIRANAGSIHPPEPKDIG